MINTEQFYLINKYSLYSCTAQRKTKPWMVSMIGFLSQHEHKPFDSLCVLHPSFHKYFVKNTFCLLNTNSLHNDKIEKSCFAELYSHHFFAPWLAVEHLLFHHKHHDLIYQFLVVLSKTIYTTKDRMVFGSITLNFTNGWSIFTEFIFYMNHCIYQLITHNQWIFWLS